ncbi:hypothetical protein [Corynebacterium glyciniphilum]|uniref:hypothetical protein n=1 Tax=Corynebacterium glyciniphilum TaxID=1404244 RepID=UPI0011AB43CE|nr:hypothetical protein [Corynebacterium glyciniphilum]
MTIRRTALAAVACGALALTACGDAEAEGEYHGFDTEAEYSRALDDFACGLAEDGAYAVQAYNTVREDPELSSQYGIPSNGDPQLLHDITYGTTTYDCSVPWVREGAAKTVENGEYFDRDYAIEEGVIEE